MVLTVTLFVLYLACVCFQRRKALSGRSLLERGFSVFQQGNGGKRWRRALIANVSLRPALSIPPALRALTLSERGVTYILQFA